MAPNNFRHWLSGYFGSSGEDDPEKLDTLPFDGIPWHFPRINQRIVAVGDLHGDIAALASVLHAARTIDDLGNWTGVNTQVVLLGDLIGGHDDSRLLLEFILRLDTQARRRGGAVHTLLGNHDLLAIQGEHRSFTRKEKKLYKKSSLAQDGFTTVSDAFTGDGPFARWLRRCNVILILEESVFVHAGLGPWARQADLGRVNATVRAWVRYWQGIGNKPAKSTRWTVGKRKMQRGSKWEAGPSWNRSYKVKSKNGKKWRHTPQGAALTKGELEEILTRVGAIRLVVGHSPLDDGQILLHHPAYGEKVVMADTRLSDADGTLCAVELEHGGVRQITADSRKMGERVREHEIRRLKEERLAPRGQGWLNRILNWTRYRK